MTAGSHAWLDAPVELQPLLLEAEGSEARGRWRVAREQYEHAMREWPCPPKSGVPIARVVRRVARCHLEEGDLCGALDVLRTARVVATQYDDSVGIAHAINLEGIIARQRGDLADAEYLFRGARSIAWNASEQMLVAMIDQNLGTVANIRGNRAEAKLRYEASLAAYQVLNIPQAIGPLHNNLGMLHTDLRQWSQAERHYREALRYAISTGDVAGRLRTYVNRAELYVLLRRFRKAKRLCRRVLALGLGERCEGGWLADAFKHLGVVARETGDREEAARSFASALRLAEQREDALLTAEILSELAVLHHEMNRNAETLAALTRAHTLFTKLSARADLADVDRKLRDLELQFLDIVRRWGESIESADSYTQGHCRRVADLACLLAQDAGLDESALLWFRMGALLHDVGKLAVPVEVLNKDGALTPDELALMRKHPEAGAAIVGATEFPWDIRPMIRHHHERWNGTGYPDNLRGEEIPRTARILCVADVYDALTSARSYRAAYAPQVAIAIMEAEIGQTFDPLLLRTFFERTLPRLRARARIPLAAPSFAVSSAEEMALTY